MKQIRWEMVDSDYVLSVTAAKILVSPAAAADVGVKFEFYAELAKFLLNVFPNKMTKCGATPRHENN